MVSWISVALARRDGIDFAGDRMTLRRDADVVRRIAARSSSRLGEACSDLPVRHLRIRNALTAKITACVYCRRRGIQCLRHDRSCRAGYECS